MKRIPLMLLFTTLLLLAPASLHAQEETQPLLEMLALVPDNAQTAEGIPAVSYADYRAVEAARGIPTLTAADFAEDTETSGLWIAASTGLASGPSFLQYVFSDMERTQELMGFAFFDIDRALEFGMPPSMGRVLAGNFDSEQIAAAYTARDFKQTEMEGVPVWCGPSGCESGQDPDLTGRDLADLFGGALGRKEPVAILAEGLLANSPDIGVVESIIAAHNGTQRSLAENRSYLAAAEAVTASGIVRQAQLFNWFDLGVVAAVEMRDLQQQALEEFAASVEPLPPYEVAVLADVWDEAENTQIALIGLVYDDAETAETAAQVLAGRVEHYVSARTGQPFTERLADSDAEMVAPSVYSSEAAGRWVALLPFAYPTPSNEPREEFPRFEGSSILFRFLINAVYARDFYLIATDFPAP